MIQTNIQEDRKQRIIRAGMEVFAKNGYKKATIDEIVAQANVSKGLLFHHYGNKKKLYLLLYEFAYSLVHTRVTKAFEHLDSDLFERIQQTMQIKLEIMRAYPCVLDFLVSVRGETDPVLQEEISRLKTIEFSPWKEPFMTGIDRQKLRDGIEPEDVIRIILWCTNGLLAEHKDAFIIEDIFAEMNRYLNLLRHSFYKEEYQ